MQHADRQKQRPAAWAADIEARLNALPNTKVETVRTLRREFSKRMSRKVPSSPHHPLSLQHLLADFVCYKSSFHLSNTLEERVRSIVPQEKLKAFYT
jgi:hypothetical protein